MSRTKKKKFKTIVFYIHISLVVIQFMRYFQKEPTIKKFSIADIGKQRRKNYYIINKIMKLVVDETILLNNNFLQLCIHIYLATDKIRFCSSYKYLVILFKQY